MVAGTLGLIASGAGLLSSAFGVGKSVYDARHQEELPGASGAMRATGSLSLMNLEDIMSQQGMSASTTQRMNEQASRTTDKQLENINALGLFAGLDPLAFEQVSNDIMSNALSIGDQVIGKTISGDIQANAAQTQQASQAANVTANIESRITQREVNQQVYADTMADKTGTAIATSAGALVKAMGSYGEYVDKYIEDYKADNAVAEKEIITVPLAKEMQAQQAGTPVNDILDTMPVAQNTLAASSYTSKEGEDWFDELVGRSY